MSIGGLSESRSGVRPAANDGSGSTRRSRRGGRRASRRPEAVPAVGLERGGHRRAGGFAAPQPAPAQTKAKKWNTTAIAAAVVGVLAVGGAAVGYVTDPSDRRVSGAGEPAGRSGRPRRQRPWLRRL